MRLCRELLIILSCACGFGRSTGTIVRRTLAETAASVWTRPTIIIASVAATGGHGTAKTVQCPPTPGPRVRPRRPGPRRRWRPRRPPQPFPRRQPLRRTRDRRPLSHSRRWNALRRPSRQWRLSVDPASPAPVRILGDNMATKTASTKVSAKSSCTIPHCGYFRVVMSSDQILLRQFIKIKEIIYNTRAYRVFFTVQ